MRIGPMMTTAQSYVEQHPGCTMMDAAYYVAPTGVPGGTPGLGYGYRTVHRAIRAGLIKARERADKRGCYRLYPTRTD